MIKDIRFKKYMQERFTLSEAKGFTIVELLLYMGIFSILLLVLLDLLTAILGVHAESQSTSAVDQDGNYIVTKLTYDIHRAATIFPSTLSVPSTSMEFTGTGFDETYSIDASNNVIVTDNTVTPHVNYQLNGPYTTGTLSFIPYGNSGGKASVKVALVLTSRIKQKGGIVQQQEFDTTVAMR